MRECQKEFAKEGKQEQIPDKSFTDKPVVRYVHNCKATKIGLVVTPETEVSKAALYQSISKTCYKHCKKIK